MPLVPPRPVAPDLWTKLEALDLDGGAALSFSKRLARDNGWSDAFARRVVLEYKKFVFLAATCGHPVTPSDEVDQAWHLHLVYTHSYWDELCGQVLGFPLHHGPTKGGPVEGHKFQDWYARTLQAYWAAFGTLPPADIWPVAAVRFGEAPHYRRVNLRRQWLLPRPRWPFRPGRREALALAAVLLLASCTAARLPLNPLDWHGTEFLVLFWGLALTLLPLAVWLSHRGAGRAHAPVSPPPTTYELARLAGHGRLVADCALAALVHTGQAALVPERRIRRTEATPPTDPYERAVWNLIIPADWSELDVVREVALGPNIGALNALDDALEAKGLLLPPEERCRRNHIPLLTALALGVFGFAKVMVGLSRDRPVGLLVLSLLALGIAVVSYRRSYGVWATGSGARLLREAMPVVRQARRAGEVSGPIVALLVALFGVGELAKLGLGALAASLRPPQPSGGDGGLGCSSGDGGGGSGCGGCGGD